MTLEAECGLDAAREMARQAREHLSTAGLGSEELSGWELVMVEAANNAVRYCVPEFRHLPVRLDVMCLPDAVEVRLHDHTPGFDFPDNPELPEDDSEHGRGLFLIRALTDEVSYLRGRSGNCLFLRKTRPAAAKAAGQPSSGDELAVLRARNEENETVLQAMTEDLAASYESLSAIFRFTAELSQSHKFREFARRWLKELTGVTGADWFVLRFAGVDPGVLEVFARSPEDWNPASLAINAEGTVPETAEQRAISTCQDVWFDAGSPLRPGDPLTKLGPMLSGLVHPIFVGELPIGVLTVGRRTPDRPFAAGQVNVIHTFADFLGIQLSNVRYQEDYVRSRVTTRELEIAAGIQRSLLPEALPELGGLGMAGSCSSARHVGGDFYDALRLTGGTALLAIADVMGKGVPAAMFAAILRSQIRARLDLASSPGKFLTWLNAALYPDLNRVEMFITAQIVFVDMTTRTLKVAGAGHPAMLLADSNGVTQPLASDGMPLGILPDTVYEEVQGHMPDDGCAMMFTDGLTEARNPQGQLLGQAAIEGWLREAALNGVSATECRIFLASKLRQYQGGAALADDQTFLVLSTKV